MSYMNIVKNCGYAYYNEKYYQRKAIHRINKNSEEKADWRKHIEKIWLPVTQWSITTK